MTRLVRRGPITAEAMVALTFARAMVALPYACWRHLVGQARTDQPAPAAMSTQPRHTSIRQAIDAATARLPWHSSCLVRAIAGQVLLRHRGQASSLVIGVSAGHGAVEAHAWLMAGDSIVLGAADASAYRPIATFGRRTVARSHEAPSS